MMEEISLISTAIMAIATTVLAGTTIYYAIMNRRLWLNMEKQVMRPRKEEEIKHIIKPLLKQCELEVNHLNEKHYRWFSKEITLANMFHGDSSKRVVFNAFVREKPVIKKLIEENDGLVGRLKNEFNSFVNFINTVTFRSRIEKLIIKSDKESGKITTKVSEGNINYYFNWIIDFLKYCSDFRKNFVKSCFLRIIYRKYHNY